MSITPTTNTNFQKVLNVGANIAVGAVTLVGVVGLTAKTVALVAKPVFAKLATSALASKIGGSTVVAILGGPVGWALFGLATLVGTVYIGYKLYQAYKAHEAEEKIATAALTPLNKADPRLDVTNSDHRGSSSRENKGVRVTYGTLNEIPSDDEDDTMPVNLNAVAT